MIETTNLTLRPVTLADFDHAYSIFNNSDVMAFSGEGVWNKSKCEAWLKNQQEGVGCNLGLAVIHKGSHQVIGYTALEELPEEISQDAEITVFLAKDYWGKGFAQECVNALTHYAFNEFKLQRLVAVVHSDNKAARALVEKSNFREERNINVDGIGAHIIYALNSNSL